MFPMNHRAVMCLFHIPTVGEEIIGDLMLLSFFLLPTPLNLTPTTLRGQEDDACQSLLKNPVIFFQPPTPHPQPPTPPELPLFKKYMPDTIGYNRLQAITRVMHSEMTEWMPGSALHS